MNFLLLKIMNFRDVDKTRINVRNFELNASLSDKKELIKVLIIDIVLNNLGDVLWKRKKICY